MFKNRAKVINFEDLPDAKFRSSAAISMVLSTLRAMGVTNFKDAEMSAEGKKMIFTENRRETGENIGKGIFKCASETYVATFSLYGHTVSVDVGKTPELCSFLLSEGYDIKDVVKCNVVFDQKLETNDWFAQIVVDLAKNMGSIKGLINMRDVVCVTHESDLAKHSGEKKVSYVNNDGKVVTTYRHDWRLPDAAGDRFVDRSYSAAPDIILCDYIKETIPLFRFFEPVKADEFGVTIYRLSEDGKLNIKPNTLDRNKLLIPNAVRGLRISVHSFNAWNKTDRGVKVERRMPKDLTTFDLCDLFYDLYDSRLTHSNDEESRKAAYDFAMDEIGKLIRTVDGTISDDRIAATVNNSFVFWSIPADLDLGFKWDEDGNLLNPDLEVKFDRNAFVHFKQGTEIFGDLWAKYASENESLVEINKRDRESEMIKLFEANELRKKHKSSDEGNFTGAIFNDDILAAIDC